MNEIPVYLFTGFMDSGKTSLIKDTLFEQGFAKEGKSLVICCEDGDAEFTDEELEKNNVKLDDRTAACHGRCNDFRYVSCKYAYNDHGTAFFRRCRDLQSL